MWQVRSAGVQRTIVTLRGEQDDGLGQSPAGRKIPTAPVLLTRVRMLRSFAIKFNVPSLGPEAGFALFKKLFKPSFRPSNPEVVVCFE